MTSNTKIGVILGLEVELVNVDRVLVVVRLDRERHALLNRRGTTWRQLAPEVKDRLDTDSAIEIMLANPAIIKRPLLVTNGQRYLGFSHEQYSQIF